MGDSAGANLYAAVCLVSRDDGPVPIAQSLVYPATDLRMTATSIDTFATGSCSAKGHALVSQPLRARSAHRAGSAGLAVTRRGDLSGLPPAAGMDGGVRSTARRGMDYAERLREAGNYAEHTCFDDQIHGFFGMGVLPGHGPD